MKQAALGVSNYNKPFETDLRKRASPTCSALNGDVVPKLRFVASMSVTAAAVSGCGDRYREEATRYHAVAQRGSRCQAGSVQLCAEG